MLRLKLLRLRLGAWMVKLLNKKIDDLFQAIHESSEYQEYVSICKVIDSSDEIQQLVNEIKRLQQKSVKLEAKKDDSYKEVDKVIEEKVLKLNSIPLYQEYIRRMNELNDILAESTFQIEKYINDKI